MRNIIINDLEISKELTQHSMQERKGGNGPVKCYEALRDAVWVANNIEASRRRDNLTWGYHREVASLKPDQQDYWLFVAEDEGLSQSQLRAAIKQYRTEVLGVG